MHDLSADLDGMLMTWDIEDYFMDGPSALSPDGTKVAMVMQAFQNTTEDRRTGVWMLDVPSGELTQVATWADYAAAIPEWQQVPPWGRAVQWTGDSAGFVVLVTAWTSQFPMNVFYYIDAASGEMTPVVDFSGVESFEAAMTAPEGEIPMRFYLAVDGDGFAGRRQAVHAQ